MQCVLKIRDQVNVKFDGLDPKTRKKIYDSLRFMVPYARHVQSFQMGRWDGKVNYATMGGGLYLNLLEKALPIVMDAGYEVTIQDERPEFKVEFPKDIDENLVAHKCWPEGHPAAGQPIVLRDYQVGAIKNYFENTQSIQCLSTGAGKTILTASLSLLCEPYGRTLVIVPSKSLVEQTEEDYLNLGLDVGVFFGDRKEYGHKHTIATWQSLGSFCKKKDDFTTVDLSFEEFIDGIQCVMVDECHTAKAATLKSLMTGPLSHVPIRWGMTGTVPKQDFEFYALLSSIGPVVGEVKAKELQDRGVLANCNIEVIQLQDDHVAFKDYHAEHDFLLNDPDRLKFIAEFISQLDGNTLVLMDRISTIDALHELLPQATRVSGKTKQADRKQEYKSFHGEDDKILLASYGVAATGISVTRLFNIVFIEAGKSFTRTIQATGRGLRKGMDKEEVTIWDICSSLKFSKRHLTERKKYYKDAEYPFKINKVDY